MNKIVREHYPVANLPEDLREGLDVDAKVRVVVEVDVPSTPTMPDFSSDNEKPLTIEEILEIRRRLFADGRPSVSAEEAVSRIRELRDEWDY